MNDGFRSICIGLETPEFGSCTCAACGLVKLAAAALAALGGGIFSLPRARLDVKELLLLLRDALSADRKWLGEFLRLGASGHPHSGVSVSGLTDSGEE